MTSSTDQWQKTLWFAYIAVLVCLNLNAYAEIGNYLRQGTLFAVVINGRPYINDAVQVYNAAVLARKCAGDKLDMYDPVLQEQGLRSLVAPVIPETNQYVFYPPQFYALVLPLSLLSITGAFFVWCAVSLVLILIALWFLCRTYLEPGFARAFAFAGTLGCFPAWQSFELAQTSLFQFPATIAFWLLLRSQKFFYAGLVSAALFVKLQYMPALVLTGLIIGRLRYLAGLLLSTSILAVATLAIVGWNNTMNYPRALQFASTSTTVGGIAPDRMQNFRGELVLLYGSDNRIINQLSLAIFVLGTVLVCILWLKLYPYLKERMGADAFGICASISILVSLVASPHTHTQDFLTATLAAILLYPFLRSQKRTRLKSALAFLLIGYPILSWVLFFQAPAFQIIRLQPYFLWAMVVLCLTGLLVHCRSR